MTVRHGIIAQIEITQALDYYRAKSDRTAYKFLIRFDRTVARIVLNPSTYPKIQRYRGHREIRYLSLDKFPYSLIYEVAAEGIVTISLWHQKSRGEDWSKRET